MQRLVHTYSHDLDAPPSRVFPLLCPVREYDWIFDWTCEMVHSKSGVAELDCVFRTNFPDSPGSVWTCSRYEPDRAIDYVVFCPGMHVQHLSIRLSEVSPDKTRLEWTRLFTAISPDGDTALEEAAATRLPAIDAKLKESLQHYFATGTIWRQPMVKV